MKNNLTHSFIYITKSNIVEYRKDLYSLWGRLSLSYYLSCHGLPKINGGNLGGFFFFYLFNYTDL